MENQNSVAYVGKIGSVSEIPGADNIELVTIGGWNAITKKGEYQVSDKVVVATTDAVIPQQLSDPAGLAPTSGSVCRFVAWWCAHVSPPPETHARLQIPQKISPSDQRPWQRRACTRKRDW